MAYLGELYVSASSPGEGHTFADPSATKVSDFLTRVLGDAYIPNDHWLSPLRIADGHAIYRPEGKEYFKFRFTDTTARFSQFLLDNGVELDENLLKLRTFHIGVYTTIDNIRSRFSLDHDHYEQVRISIPPYLLLSQEPEEQSAVNSTSTDDILDPCIHGR